MYDRYNEHDHHMLSDMLQLCMQPYNTVVILLTLGEKPLCCIHPVGNVQYCVSYVCNM